MQITYSVAISCDLELRNCFWASLSKLVPVGNYEIGILKKGLLDEQDWIEIGNYLDPERIEMFQCTLFGLSNGTWDNKHFD